jgi:hypothetical protein
MLRKVTALWIVGLLTLVPYATYYLFFRAPREQYAILITFVLFWIFGYWGVVGPLLALIKVRTVFRRLQHVKSSEDLVMTLQSAQARDVAIDLIATENHIPRFLASRVHELLVKGLSARAPVQGAGGAENRQSPNDRE